MPDVINMPYSQGEKVLQDAGFEVICNDSVFMKDLPPGTITDVIPVPGSVVKSGREVYVTRVCYMPQTIVIDRDIAKYTVREFENMLKHYDIKFGEVEVPSEVNGNLVGVNYKRIRLGIGDKIAVGDSVTVLIGKMVEPMLEENPIDAVIGSIYKPGDQDSDSVAKNPLNTGNSSDPEADINEDLPLQIARPSQGSSSSTEPDVLDEIISNL